MERLVSPFAFTGRAKEPGAASEEMPDDPRMERAMMEMEQGILVAGATMTTLIPAPSPA